jgi:peptidase m23, putative
MSKGIKNYSSKAFSKTKDVSSQIKNTQTDKLSNSKILSKSRLSRNMINARKKQLSTELSQVKALGLKEYSQQKVNSKYQSTKSKVANKYNKQFKQGKKKVTKALKYIKLLWKEIAIALAILLLAIIVIPLIIAIFGSFGSSPHYYCPTEPSDAEKSSSVYQQYCSNVAQGDGISTGELGYPLEKTCPITSPYGPRNSLIAGMSTFHKGLDYGAPAGTKILACDGGTIEIAGVYGGYGNCVVIKHSGKFDATRYGHMSKVLVTKGQQVSKGDVIGLVGSSGISTGPHLHLELYRDGKPIDPAPYVAKEAGKK